MACGNNTDSAHSTVSENIRTPVSNPTLLGIWERHSPTNGKITLEFTDSSAIIHQGADDDKPLHKNYYIQNGYLFLDSVANSRIQKLTMDSLELRPTPEKERYRRLVTVLQAGTFTRQPGR